MMMLIKLCYLCFVFSVATVEQLKQTYVLTPADMKDAYMVHIVDQYTEDNPTSSVMIFTNTCK